MAMFIVPVCVCFHPLDAHDAKTNECMLHGCSCPRFEASGQVQKVEAS
jgi:hypothetical protein